MLDWLQLVWRGAESRSEAPDDGERLCRCSPRSRRSAWAPLRRPRVPPVA